MWTITWQTIVQYIIFCQVIHTKNLWRSGICCPFVGNADQFSLGCFFFSCCCITDCYWNWIYTRNLWSCILSKQLCFIARILKIPGKIAIKLRSLRTPYTYVYSIEIPFTWKLAFMSIESSQPIFAHLSAAIIPWAEIE